MLIQSMFCTKPYTFPPSFNLLAKALPLLVDGFWAVKNLELRFPVLFSGPSLTTVVSPGYQAFSQALSSSSLEGWEVALPTIMDKSASISRTFAYSLLICIYLGRHLYLFAGPAVTKYRGLGGLNNRNLFLRFCKSEVQDQGVSRFSFFWGLSPSTKTAAFLLCLPRVFSLCECIICMSWSSLRMRTLVILD